MNDRVVGSMIRAARVRVRWRQVDLERRSGVPVRKISHAERGRLGGLSIGQLRAIGEAMDIVADVVLRSRSGDLDRLIRAGHSALHEEVARFFRALPDWVTEHEVSYSVFGERGVIDIFAWHPRRRAPAVRIARGRDSAIAPGAMALNSRHSAGPGARARRARRGGLGQACEPRDRRVRIRWKMAMVFSRYANASPMTIRRTKLPVATPAAAR
jgi:transcriptional regulator with XRE-family HTH domain